MSAPTYFEIQRLPSPTIRPIIGFGFPRETTNQTFVGEQADNSSFRDFGTNKTFSEFFCLITSDCRGRAVFKKQNTNKNGSLLGEISRWVFKHSTPTHENAQKKRVCRSSFDKSRFVCPLFKFVKTPCRRRWSTIKV